MCINTTLFNLEREREREREREWFMQELFKPFNSNDGIDDDDRQYPMVMYTYTYTYTYYVGSTNPHHFISS
jgi:hypothetical protein